MGERQGSSSNGLHFLDATFLDQWYPEEFLAKSMVAWGGPAGAPRKMAS